MGDSFENFEFEEKFNPWNVKSLEDFLYYCCPQCDHKNITKSAFIKHAVVNHSKSQELIESLENKHEIQNRIKSANTNDEHKTISDNSSNSDTSGVKI